MPANKTAKAASLYSLWFYILITLLIGILGGLIGGNSGFRSLNAPPLTPPGWVFPIVWTILYVLMAVAAWLIHQSGDIDRDNALWLYFFQLGINALWPLLFFRLSWRLFTLLWIFLLIALIVLMILRFRSIHPLAAWLLLPYLAWCIFAAYLNFGFYLLNG